MPSSTKRPISANCAPAAGRRSSRARFERDFLNPSSATTQLHDNQRESTVARQDPLEKKGRELWASSIDLPRSSRFLGKFANSLADWGFYPLKHGSSKDVKKRGIRGVHYAEGYTELGSMVDEYGTDITQWSNLPGPPVQEEDFSFTQLKTWEDYDAVSINTVQRYVQSPDSMVEAASSISTPEHLSRVCVILGGVKEQHLIQMNSSTSSISSANNVHTAGTIYEVPPNVGAAVSPEGNAQCATTDACWEENSQLQRQKEPLVTRVQNLETKLHGEVLSGNMFSERLRSLEREIFGKEDLEGSYNARLERLELHTK